ncbi:MAG: type II toxin-antitoxin system VapC family toxin [Nitrospirae bacterium]|nr:type II toxin-antitoxin system VapC family toxin [Nitrospirota bacterium]
MPRVYADTSVFGGVFDEEFRETSRTLFRQIRDGRFSLVTSALVQEEIAPAPPDVQRLFADMLGFMEVAEINQSALDLRSAYVEAGVVAPKWAEDALHVAIATIAGCTMIVSWNFKHIVHYDKIPLYNAINVLKGHAPISIFSPQEVIVYEDQDL